MSLGCARTDGLMARERFEHTPERAKAQIGKASLAVVDAVRYQQSEEWVGGV